MDGVVALAGALSFWLVVLWLICGFFAGYVAYEKGRWGFWWFVMGLLFGPIALLAVVGLPDISSSMFQPSPKTHVTCPDCAEFVRNKAKVCPYCSCKLTPYTN